MSHDFLAELFGTMILILLGDGVVAAVVLNQTKAQNSGWIVITTGWAFAVMCGVFTCLALGGRGHLNPAVTLAALATNAIDNSTALKCIAGEFAGAFLGAILVWVHYLPHWPGTPDKAAKLAVFCNAPAIRNTPANLICEIIGTFVLVFVGSAISKANAVAGFGPYLAGTVVWSIGLSLGATTGYAINPARDLAPRMAHALLPIDGKGDSDWNYSWIPVIGPIIGGIGGAVLFQQLVG
jgi:glycerol uptake facilitator protein